MEEKQSLVKRFENWKEHICVQLEESGDTLGIPFQFSPEFTDSPTYELKSVDKHIEVYTLHETLTTEGVGDVFLNLLESPFFPLPFNVFEQKSLKNISSGLIVYVQPLIDDEGVSVEQQIELETILPSKSASDILVVILKTGAKLRLSHTYTENSQQSLLSRTTLFLLEEDSFVYYLPVIQNTSGSVVEREISLISGMSHHMVGRVISPLDTYGIRSLVHLLGSCAHGTIETSCIARDDAHIYIAENVQTGAPDAHECIRSYLSSGPHARIQYASSIDGDPNNKDSSDEVWINNQHASGIHIVKSKSHILRNEISIGADDIITLRDNFSTSGIQIHMGIQKTP